MRPRRLQCAFFLFFCLWQSAGVKLRTCRSCSPAKNGATAVWRSRKRVGRSRVWGHRCLGAIEVAMATTCFRDHFSCPSMAGMQGETRSPQKQSCKRPQSTQSDHPISPRRAQRNQGFSKRPYHMQLGHTRCSKRAQTQSGR